MSAKIVRVRPFAIAAIARNDGDVKVTSLDPRLERGAGARE